MKNPVISTYMEVVGKIGNMLPPKEHVVKFVYHIGRAANEVNKGVKSFKRKAGKEDESLKPKKITIE